MSRSSDPNDPGEFLKKSALGVALVGLVLLTPFSINNFLQARPFLGVGSLAIVLLFGFNSWAIVRRGRYYPMLTLLGLVPAIVFFLALSLRRQGIIGVLWCYPAVICFNFILPERKAWIANAVLLLAIVPIAWTVTETAIALRMSVTLFMVSVLSLIFVRVITAQQEKLREDAATDPLTGVLNRKLLSIFVENAIQHRARTGEPVTVASFDLDHFKRVNDTKGHDAGDRVLRNFADLLRRRCRRTDKIFRVGGEEFLVLLPGTDAENALRVAEALRSAVEANPLSPDHEVTVSVGVATLQSGEGMDTWLKRSDESLYRAKASGRNRVETG